MFSQYNVWLAIRIPKQLVGMIYAQRKEHVKLLNSFICHITEVKAFSYVKSSLPILVIAARFHVAEQRTQNSIKHRWTVMAIQKETIIKIVNQKKAKLDELLSILTNQANEDIVSFAKRRCSWRST
jgi:GTPase involved in cell partitioning and DNA repair